MTKTEDKARWLIKRAYVQLLLREGERGGWERGEEREEESGGEKKWEKKAKVGTFPFLPRPVLVLCVSMGTRSDPICKLSHSSVTREKSLFLH